MAGEEAEEQGGVPRQLGIFGRRGSRRLIEREPIGPQHPVLGPRPQGPSLCFEEGQGREEAQAETKDLFLAAQVEE
jgi:hypothetical protein